MNKWTNIEIGLFIDFNPREVIAKNTVAKKISMDKLKEFSRKIVGYEYGLYKGAPKFKNGDTLLAKITPCLENGKTAQVDILEDGEVGFGSSEFIVLRQNKNSINDFIFYLAQSPAFRKRAIGCMEGTSGRKRVNENALKLQILPVPELKMQKEIALVLSSLDAKIELNNKINSELEGMAKTLYDYWFVQYDFPNEKGKPYKSSDGKMVYCEELKREIPKGWEVENLLGIADFTNGLACQKFRPVDNTFLKVIKIREMNTGFTFNTEFTRTNIPGKYIVQNGDVLFSWSASLDVKLWSSGIGALNQHIFKLTSQKYPRFFYYFEVLNYLAHFKMMAESRKTTMGHITQEHLKQSKIAVPEINLINKLHKVIDPILNKVISNNIQNQELTELRDWLLPMLMNGQVTVGNVAYSNSIQPKAAINSTLLLPIITRRIKTNLGIGYGEVGIQKTVYNIGAVGGVNMNYAFVNHNNGTYSKQLKDDLKANPYLSVDKALNVFIIKQDKEAEIDAVMSQKVNKDFLTAVDTVLNIYKSEIINKKTYRIELFNTTLKLISDLQTIDFSKIYTGFENWKIKNDKKYTTKAERFKKPSAQKMLEFIVGKKLHLKLINI
jgi:type I restriction enzyme, S subunit